MKRLPLISLSLIASISFAQNAILPGGCVVTKEPPAFYEKANQVNEQLYRISANELQDFLGCNYEHIPTISAQELQNLMAENPSVRVVNVLPKNLYDDCHILNSESVPLKELVAQAADWPRNELIIVYCALDICDAGQKAYVLLSCMGFTNVIDYEGGIKEWFQLGYPTEGPAECTYLHAKFAKLPDELLSELSECCGVSVPRDAQ